MCDLLTYTGEDDAHFKDSDIKVLKKKWNWWSEEIY